MKSKVVTEMNVCDSPSDMSTNDDWYANELQLAAELGKGLLDRNQELEGVLERQQGLVEDQALEIQVLSRQSVALREVNESRLRVYEQLEAGISELENTNQQLKAEAAADKKRIKSLCQSVEALEGKCLDLQQLVDDLKASERLRRRRDRHRTIPSVTSSVLQPFGMEQGPSSLDRTVALPFASQQLQRRHSLNDHSPAAQQESEEEQEWVVRLRTTVSRLKSQLAKEETTSQDLREQVLILEQENGELQEQQRLLEQQQERLALFHQAERLYWACRRCRRSQADCTDAEEDAEEHTPLAFQGGPDEGGGGGLAGAGGLQGLSTGSEEDRNRISLLSELDAQYRAIIKKYEDLLSSGQPECFLAGGHQAACSNQSNNSLFRSLSQELSEASDLSSGVFSCPEEEDDDSPAGEDSSSSSSSVVEHRAVQTEKEEPHFHSGPPFKQLFDDIFAVLNRSAPTDYKVKNSKLRSSTVRASTVPDIKVQDSIIREEEDRCPAEVATVEGQATPSLEYQKEIVLEEPSSKLPAAVKEYPPTRKVRDWSRSKVRANGLGQEYCIPVPPLVGCPLFKLPGHHSYAQVVRMAAARAAWETSHLF